MKVAVIFAKVFPQTSRQILMYMQCKYLVFHLYGFDNTLDAGFRKILLSELLIRIVCSQCQTF